MDEYESLSHARREGRYHVVLDVDFRPRMDANTHE
jgi:hypothetical protein